MKSIGAILCLCAVLSSKIALANTSIDDYINDTRSLTYDCPDPEQANKVDDYLSSAENTSIQKLELQLIKTHHFICIGRHLEAQDILRNIVENPTIDKQSESYAMALYQLGFVYDVQELNERCNLYYRAREVSEGKFEDINVSAKLGLLTACSYDTHFSGIVENVYALLEEYSNSQNFKLLAHLHNSFGLIFADAGMHIQAAEQFLKAHELGLKVYNGSNQLSILVSALVSLRASGQYDELRVRLKEFDEINQNIKTPLTNFWYHLQKVAFHYDLEEYSELELSLNELEKFKNKVNNPYYDALFGWYDAVICLYKEDKKCVFTYVDTIKEYPTARYLNEKHIEFEVRAWLFLKNPENAGVAFDKYVKKMQQDKEVVLTRSTQFGISGLYQEISSLEAKVKKAEEVKTYSVALILGLLLLIAIVAFYLYRRQIKNNPEVDQVTGLLNLSSFIEKVEKLSTPHSDKAHALAIFDLGNFREVNRLLGGTKGDLILSKVSSTFSSVTREDDIVGRLAPEQIILCLVNIDEKSATAFMHRTQRVLESSFKDLQQGLDISLNSNFSIYTTADKFDDVQLIIEQLLQGLQHNAHN